ncbi:MarR family transcriptional regulator, partial [Tannerella sp. oral taxon 808]
RGIRKGALPYDLWAKDITPSPALRQWFHEDPVQRWPEFEQRYRIELDTAPTTDAFVDQLKDHKTITLLYASKDAVHNHALILQDYLTQRLRPENNH